MNTHRSGFSLVELLIVIVIVGILAALSIPGLLASRRSANEGSTVSSLRLLHGAQITYASSFGVGAHSSDTVPAQFFFSSIPISADPIAGTGNHRFGIATDGVLRSDATLTSHYANIAAVTSASAMGN